MSMYKLQITPKSGKISVVSTLSTRMKYTVKDLFEDFPNEEACLKWLVEYLYPEGITCSKCEKITKHYPIKGRKVYSCGQCGNHVSPTAGTIFHKSRTPLTSWFYAIYLMSSNKAGTPATQIARELGVTYKCAWRMMHQIRKMMEAPDDMFAGEVQIDEAYWHANTYKRSSARKRYGYTGQRAGQKIFGIVQPGGAAKAWHVRTTGVRVLMPLIEGNIQQGSLIHSDGFRAYATLPRRGYEHRTTDHGTFEFYTAESHTQNIENLWSTMKPRWRGTFKHLSNKHLQAYINEFVWRYSNRNRVSMFWALMMKIVK